MKIAFYTLGCKVNQYETQALKEKFVAKGYEIVGEDEFADVYVINTCTVTGLADRKSRQYIRRMKKINPESITAVIGCYAQVSPEEVKSIEGVNIIAGTNEKSNLPDYVDAFMAEQRKQAEKGSRLQQESHIKGYEELAEYEETGIITSMESRTRAFIKIQEGCNQFCTYCIIPYARGRVRSRTEEDIIKEAGNLISKGFKEIVLTGINTALYGTEDINLSDADELHGIESVIRRLNELPGDFRIRLGSLEPTVINAGYVKRLLKYEKLCHHMHLSLQSGSNRILKLMNRHYDRDGYKEIVNVLRQFDKNYGLTTDIIVGFPGETEDDFNDTMKMLKDISFNKVHIFQYSKRRGTKAAEMTGQITPEIKKRRSAELARAAEAGSYEFIRSNIGTVRQVLLEEYDEAEGMISGYTDNYIKTFCRIKDRTKAEKLLNRFINIKIIKPYKEECVIADPAQ